MGRSVVNGLRAVVFGCTGFIGRHLVNRLGQHGSQVIVAFRGDEYDVWPLRQMGDLKHIIPRRFHLRRPDLIEAAVSEGDIVINLVGQDRRSWRFTPRDVNVDGVATIAAAAKAAGKRLIHVSHLGAKENAKSEFLRSKWEGEEAVRAVHPGAIIVRPGTVFGAGDRLVNAIDLCTHMPLGLPVLGDGRAAKWPVYVGDVAEGLYQLAMSSDRVDGRTLDFHGPEKCSWLDMIDWYRYYTMRSLNVVHFSNPSLFTLYTRFSIEWRRPLFTKDLAISWTEDEVPDPGHGSFKALGLTELTTLDQVGIALTRFMRPQSKFDDLLEPRARTP